MKKIIYLITIISFLGVSLKSQAQTVLSATDAIVQGSLGIGFDMNVGYAFGFSTLVLKENNLRIRFEDTSNSGSFATTDWELEANGSANGATNHFAINEVDAGTVPFKILAGAGNNALYVHSNGNVGLGTASPVVDLHIVSGNTPTMRLDQDGSNGWTPQVWDVAGNETNFFVRDVTNGSKLPFRIQPNSPENSISIKSSGYIGMGTNSPISTLHVTQNTTEPQVIIQNAGSNGGATFRMKDDLSGADFKFKSTGFGNFKIRDESNALDVIDVLGDGSGNVGVLTAGVPAFNFHVNGTAGKPGGGSWAVASDSRLKKDVRDFTDGLDLINKINTVNFKYNGKAGINAPNEYVGVIAQEMQEIAPYMVSEFKGQDGNTYLAIDPSALDFVLINAVKEQQKEITALNEEVAKSKKYDEAIKDLQEAVSQLKAENQSLIKQIGQIDIDLQQCCLQHQTGSIHGNSGAGNAGQVDNAHLAQNVPNPFNEKTVIKYYLPSREQVTGDRGQALIRIMDLKGTVLWQYDLVESGYGEIIIDANTFAPATYLYELFVGDKKIDSKKMVIQ